MEHPGSGSAHSRSTTGSEQPHAVRAGGHGRSEGHSRSGNNDHYHNYYNYCDNHNDTGNDDDYNYNDNDTRRSASDTGEPRWQDRVRGVPFDSDTSGAQVARTAEESGPYRFHGRNRFLPGLPSRSVAVAGRKYQEEETGCGFLLYSGAGLDGGVMSDYLRRDLRPSISRKVSSSVPKWCAISCCRVSMTAWRT